MLIERENSFRTFLTTKLHLSINPELLKDEFKKKTFRNAKWFKALQMSFKDDRSAHRKKPKKRKKKSKIDRKQRSKINALMHVQWSSSFEIHHLVAIFTVVANLQQ